MSLYFFMLDLAVLVAIDSPLHLFFKDWLGNLGGFILISLFAWRNLYLFHLFRLWKAKDRCKEWAVGIICHFLFLNFFKFFIDNIPENLLIIALITSILRFRLQTGAHLTLLIWCQSFLCFALWRIVFVALGRFSTLAPFDVLVNEVASFLRLANNG